MNVKFCLNYVFSISISKYWQYKDRLHKDLLTLTIKSAIEKLPSIVIDVAHGNTRLITDWMTIKLIGLYATGS